MNKLAYFLILYLSLFLTELIGSYLFLIFDSSNYDYQGCLDAVALWNLWRVLFYGLPFIILYFLFFTYVKNFKLYKPLLFSLFNLLVYILLSVLSRVIWGKNVPLPPQGVMFWITSICIFLSPIILGHRSYFKRLMGNM